MIVGGENDQVLSTSNNRISNELAHKFDGKSREVRVKKSMYVLM